MTDPVAAAREALGDAVSAYALARERRDTEQVISERWGAWLRTADAYAEAKAAAARAEAEGARAIAAEQALGVFFTQPKTELERMLLVELSRLHQALGMESGLPRAPQGLAEAPAEEVHDEAH